MKAALIPPKGFFGTVRASDYHLVLAQIKDPAYIYTYIDLVESGDYIILDNGAAEGRTVKDEYLIQRAVQYGANEIVVPDVLGEPEQTLERAHKFWEVAHSECFSTKRAKFMGVVQSQGDLGSMIKCVEGFAEMPITTLGIPRHFVDKDKYARYNFLSWLRNNGYDKRFEVHLLGTNPRFPTEICTLNEVHPWVRGVDSSLPYNYTIAGLKLDGKNHPDGGINRITGYFDVQQNIDVSLLDANIATFMRWARGTEGTAS
jgi:hypothetical protein